MDRMTNKRLYMKLDMVNYAFGFEREAYCKDSDGQLRAHTGTLVLDFAYGGVRVSRLCGPGGGERDLSPRGTMREAFDYLDAMETAVNIMRGKPQ